jgi:adenylate kinase family enzyme
MAPMDEEEARAFAGAFRQLMADVHALVPAPGAAKLALAIRAHLNTDPDELPVVEQTFAPSDHPNVQLALESIADRSPGWQLFGLPVEVLHWSGFSLTNLAAQNPHGPRFEPTAPSFANVPVDVDETLPCMVVGVWLLQEDGNPVVVLMSLGDPHRGMDRGLKLEVMARERDHSVAFLARVRDLAHELNVYRGKLLSFTFQQWGNFGLQFHRLPDVTRDDLILPDEDLVAIERHTLGIAAHAERLRAAGRHLKRGLLLFGPPGTGKTFSVMYLCNRMPDRTTILISGQAAPTLGQAAALARSLQPSMLVLEDVDLVAMERTMPGMDSTPLLFQLLNEMDGLEEDADVIFVLTTNRVELLEPALASRPGRIDQAVEIRMPDAACRRRLLDRYVRGLTLDGVDYEPLVARTDGVSAAFLKELARRAALEAAEDSSDSSLVARSEHFNRALDDLLQHRAPVLRRTLGAEGVSA